MLTLQRAARQERLKKLNLSLFWHLGEQKREINTYMLLTYESHLVFVAFILMRKI